MNGLKKYLRPFLVLGLFLGLAIGFHSFIMINIVEPAAIMLWAFRRIISSVNQNIYWMLLIIGCSILVMRLFPAENSNKPNPKYNYKIKSPNRVEYWRSLLNDAIIEKRGIEYLRSNLKELLTLVIGQEERSNPSGAKKVVLLGRTPLPISVQGFLFSPKRKRKIFSGGIPLQSLFSTPEWFRRRAIKFVQPDDTLIDEVLQWMESTMEISHDK